VTRHAHCPTAKEERGPFGIAVHEHERHSGVPASIERMLAPLVLAERSVQAVAELRGEADQNPGASV
jgi:hypothetical protein